MEYSFLLIIYITQSALSPVTPLTPPPKSENSYGFGYPLLEIKVLIAERKFYYKSLEFRRGREEIKAEDRNLKKCMMKTDHFSVRIEGL